MAQDRQRETAKNPEDIPRLFMEFVKADDFEGLATLYEDDALLALPADAPTHGNAAIAEVFRARFAGAPMNGPAGQLQPVLRCGDLAVTSTRLPDGRVTAEVARRQPDGSWRWVIDQPNV